MNDVTFTSFTLGKQFAAERARESEIMRRQSERPPRITTSGTPVARRRHVLRARFSGGT